VHYSGNAAPGRRAEPAATPNASRVFAGSIGFTAPLAEPVMTVKPIATIVAATA